MALTGIVGAVLGIPLDRGVSGTVLDIGDVKPLISRGNTGQVADGVSGDVGLLLDRGSIGSVSDFYSDRFVILTSAAPVGGRSGNFKVWNGASWVSKPCKVWNGVSWVPKTVKARVGGTWVDAL